MVDPASVYCQHLDMVESEYGTIGYCPLPSGNRFDERAIYCREHK
ncbi:DUF333 domain-containing protein [Serratia marcescens]